LTSTTYSPYPARGKSPEWPTTQPLHIPPTPATPPEVQVRYDTSEF